MIISKKTSAAPYRCDGVVSAIAPLFVMASGSMRHTRRRRMPSCLDAGLRLWSLPTVGHAGGGYLLHGRTAR